MIASRYDRTYNNAIDMVAAAVSHSKTTGRALRSIELNPNYFLLFKKGMEVLAKQIYPYEQEFLFEGIPVRKNQDISGFTKIHLRYWNENPKPIPN